MEEYISQELVPEEEEKPRRNSSRAPMKGLDERKILLLERKKSTIGWFRTSQNDLDELHQSTKESDNDHEEEVEEETKNQRKVVRFAKVEIREYPITLGDNPGGIRGPPLSIAWESFRTIKLTVVRYERVRTPKRRQLTELRTTPKYRVDLLRSLGVPIVDMYNAAQETERVRVNRHWTYETLGRMERQERMEEIRRTLRNLLTLGSYKRRERKFLEQYVPSYAIGVAS